MTQYFMIRSGRQGAYLGECLEGNFTGVDYGINQDLTGKFPETWRDFNAEYIPVWLELNPGRSKVAAGLACAALWVLGRAILQDDVILSPDSTGKFRVGKVIGPYQFVPGEILPHRRPVAWLSETYERSTLSEDLRKAMNSALTVVNLTTHGAELAALLAGNAQPQIIATSDEIEDPATFALERHLEDFLVENWDKTLLGETHDVFTDEGEIVGRQYPTDTGKIDILAISKDRKELLVVELKKGRASDAVVGQVQRYMGYIQDELMEPGQSVRGAIVALDDDIRIRRALAVTSNIDFYRYEVSFRLHPNT